MRAVVGVLFVGHGLQKLKGWFGGHGLEASAEGFEALGLRLGEGACRRGQRLRDSRWGNARKRPVDPAGRGHAQRHDAVAIDTVQAKKGPWVAKGGYECNLVLIASLFAIAASGPGTWSLDERLEIERSGGGVALA